MTEEPLTTRELEALAGLAQGRTYAAIGEAMGLSAATVKVHLMRAYGKLGANNGPHAVALAITSNLVRVAA